MQSLKKIYAWAQMKVPFTSFKMSCNAQWPVVGLRSRHPKRPSGTRARLRFLRYRRWWLKTFANDS